MDRPTGTIGQEFARFHFSLVLPFYNEEDSIVPAVTGLIGVLDGAGLDYQLVLVDNGSRDRTPVLLRELVRENHRLKPVSVDENIGLGWGVISGLREAEGEWIGYMDGDAQIAPDDVERFLARADPAQCDMVKVRRRVRRDGFIRARVSEVYVILFCLLFGIRIYDVNAKPVIFRREWLDRLSLRSRDWFIDAELTLKADHLGMRIREVPMTFHRRSAGRSSVGVATVFEFIRNIARYALGGEYKKWKTNR